eukprot:6184880-Pleurochrysis_carterae.AAC.1
MIAFDHSRAGMFPARELYALNTYWVFRQVPIPWVPSWYLAVPLPHHTLNNVCVATYLPLYDPDASMFGRRLNLGRDKGEIARRAEFGRTVDVSVYAAKW